MDTVQENVGQRVTPLVLANLGEWLIRSAYWVIQVALAQREHRVLENHRFDSIVSTNFAALTANLSLVIAEKARQGHTIESKRYRDIFDVLNGGASTTDGMVDNVAKVLKMLEGNMAIPPLPVIPENIRPKSRPGGW